MFCIWFPLKPIKLPRISTPSCVFRQQSHSSSSTTVRMGRLGCGTKRSSSIHSWINGSLQGYLQVRLNKTDLFQIMQGLFVPFARVGSGDPVRVLRLFHNKYSGYCCIHLLCEAMYNLSLPRLSANYYGLPTTVQLWAAHEPMFTVRCLVVNCRQVLYCTCLERYTLGLFNYMYNIIPSTCMLNRI